MNINIHEHLSGSAVVLAVVLELLWITVLSLIVKKWLKNRRSR